MDDCRPCLSFLEKQPYCEKIKSKKSLNHSCLAAVAQQVEHSAVNRAVVGSNPTSGVFIILEKLANANQMG